MKILLICDLFMDVSATGILVFKALQDLGHDIRVLDLTIKKEIPQDYFDLALVWSNAVPDPKFINAKHKVLFYLDDPLYIEKFYNEKREVNFEQLIKIYNYQFFSLNKIPGYEKNWLPMGSDDEIFHKINIVNKKKKSCLFLGTFRKGRRADFVREIQRRLKKIGIELYICGNGWDGFNNWSKRAYYLSELNVILNTFYVCFNLHVGDLSPSDKVHVITCSGGCLLLNGNKGGFRECYPEAPVWYDMDDLVKKIEYYLEHEEEREKMIEIMQKRSLENFTYKKQLSKLIKIMEEGGI